MFVIVVGKDETGTLLSNKVQLVQVKSVHADKVTVDDNIVEPTVPKSITESNGIINFQSSILLVLVQIDTFRCCISFSDKYLTFENISLFFYLI
jgi:hypothetical protein